MIRKNEKYDEIVEFVSRLEKYAWEPGVDEKALRLVAVGDCDCGDHVRHNDGGNYHSVIIVRLVPDPVFLRRYSLTITDTRDSFTSEQWYQCTECGEEVRSGDTHLHPLLGVDVAEMIIKALHPTGGKLKIYEGKSVIDSYYLDEEDILPLWISPFKK
jgi:hypothetical protein